MNDAGRLRRCRKCGREVAAEALGSAGVCRDCRSEIIRRATVWSRVAGAVIAGLVAIYIFGVVQPGERFIIGWVALVVVAYFGVAKLTRRVAYDIIRQRSVARGE